jgi:hypothetical protein
MGRAFLKDLIARNVEVKKPTMKPTVLAEMILTFFTGISMEQHLNVGKAGHEPKSPRLHEGGPPVVNPQFRGGLGGPELSQSLEKTLRRFGSEPNGARGSLAPDHTSRQRFTRPCRPLIKVALWNLRATVFNTVAARLAVRNLLDCLVGIQEVGGSKPLAPTTSYPRQFDVH